MTLLELVYGDIRTADNDLTDYDDELATRNAAYHLQQAVEKILKYMLFINDVPYKKTHNIAILIAETAKTDFIVRDDIINNAADITDYEVMSRYDTVFTATRDDIKSLLDMAKLLYDDAIIYISPKT